jgi:hypothetical protein
MGCDIHAYIEYHHDDKWNTHSQQGIYRNYWLFGLMAGVRDYGKVLFTDRGIPSETSLTKEIKEWNGDGHSHSWLNIGELKIVQEKLYERHIHHTYIEMKEYLKVGKPKYNEDLNRIIKVMKRLESDGKKTRLTFWFDN